MIKDSIKEHEQTFNPRNLSDLIDLYIEAKRTGDELTGNQDNISVKSYPI